MEDSNGLRRSIGWIHSCEGIFKGGLWWVSLLIKGEKDASYMMSFAL